MDQPGPQTFSQLWHEVTSSSSSNTYSLAPAFLLDGKWYAYAS
jgi:hypothetical protein